jgi:UDP-N-acetylglucosamine:LPS N-acetylglucosamine transferase
MGEAVYLHKPMLAIPLEKQFEQLLNARYLQYEGYGQSAEHVEALADLGGFLGQVDRYAAKLAGYRQDGNRELLAAVDEHLANIAAGSPA